VARAKSREFMRQDQSIAAESIPDVALDGSMDSQHPVLPQPRKGRRLLWVDDSRLLLSLYQSVFESLGFEVLATSSHEEALHHAASDVADVAILDYDMPAMNGGVLASLMKGQCPMLPVILYSGSTSIPHGAHHWVDAICPKAAPREELLTIIERLSHKDRKSSLSD
jgi:DNA-binding NtrC family response regulator